MKPTVEALLFDLGGVIIDIDFNRVFARWAQHASCEVAQLRARFTPDAAYRDHETGALSDGDYFASLRTSLGIDLSETQFLEGWNEIFVGEMPGIAALLARARQRVPLYCFSNTNRAHQDRWSVQFADVMRNFDTVFVSATIGLRKPDAAAFQFVIKEIGLPAERILFFDDNADNIAGARACGLQAMHVTSPVDVPNVLAAIGL